MSTPLGFGPQLRRLRQEAGLTLTEFSAALNYDKGHLSKVERGERSASLDLARRCDAFLGANGELQRLAVRPDAGSEADATSSPWLVGRREVLAAGTGALIDIGLSLGGPSHSASDPLLPSFRAQFDLLRKLGQSTAPGVLLPLLQTQTRMVVSLASDAPSATRAAALLLASRFAEFTGWMAQEAGDSNTALGWTGEAVQLAHAGGDPHLSSYALVRRALVTLYDGDAAATITLARSSGQRTSTPHPRTRGPAGSTGSRTRRRRARVPQQPRKGTRTARQRRRAQWHRARDRHHPRERSCGDDHRLVPVRPRPSGAAAEALDRECRRLPAQALRTRTRYGFRRPWLSPPPGRSSTPVRLPGNS